MSAVANQIRRAIGMILLGWLQGIWPAKDIAVHLAIGNVAGAVGANFKTETFDASDPVSKAHFDAAFAHMSYAFDEADEAFKAARKAARK